MAAQTPLKSHEAIRRCWIKLTCNVVRILSADGAVRNQMEFWIDSKHPNVFAYSFTVLSIRGKVIALSRRSHGFESRWDRQILLGSSIGLGH